MAGRDRERANVALNRESADRVLFHYLMLQEIQIYVTAVTDFSKHLARQMDLEY